MEMAMLKGRKTKVTEVPNGQKRHLASIILLIFCLCLFNSDAMAQPYDISNSGVSDVYGISDAGSLLLVGDDFGTVVATADTYNAYSVYSSGGDITIYGLFDTVGLISAITGTYNAIGLYTPNGSIYTDGIDGTITADANDYFAYAMYSDSNITTGNIGSDALISATAGEEEAFAVFSEFGSIDINDIDGEISAQTLNYSMAIGLYSGSGFSIHIGDVNGVITADANYSDAFAMSSWGL